MKRCSCVYEGSIIVGRSLERLLAVLRTVLHGRYTGYKSRVGIYLATKPLFTKSMQQYVETTAGQLPLLHLLHLISPMLVDASRSRSYPSSVSCMVSYRILVVLSFDSWALF